MVDSQSLPIKELKVSDKKRKTISAKGVEEGKSFEFLLYP